MAFVLRRTVPSTVLTASRLGSAAPPAASRSFFSLWVSSSTSTANAFSTRLLTSTSTPIPIPAPTRRHQGTSTSSPSPEELVRKSLKESYVLFFGKTWCPFCVKAKKVLQELELPAGEELKIYELNEMDNGDEIQDYLEDFTGQRGEHLGGCDDLMAAQRSGKLQALLALKEKRA